MSLNSKLDFKWNTQPVVLKQTQASLQQLRLQVSLNEEHVYLNISLSGEQELDLGERSHHYCLLTLARQRLSDARRGIDVSGQGWLNRKELAHMLGLDPSHLNIQIHRLRQQIAEALPSGMQLDEVVERRRGELRFGALPFCIVRGSSIEGEYLLPCNPV
ncbi:MULTISPECIES: hypothetical protein [unclassified Janthinobacterium]|uniref:hypothetical protein n=1 Tax=unclassified Janthinobacterium TaxID=2610881 RepID=UPI00161A171F|nr:MULTISPECIES: hypothetical protein [unclassified Janthinobacterium]MBB5606452.1 hypothetical protein [Janthinobacterium sp. S3T4]MBB5611676.1 hypothetical protein [Janthinobacterium sp. S3M3]